ncbi:PLP-dependent aspartate aminotransferase family protein [Gammaproteobacteria bacterium]|jgi:cystathionine beta-lyase|nr:PLP-dependent aspartate aminotransferase family protein [Gammaproteobacteria bacterium]
MKDKKKNYHQKTSLVHSGRDRRFAQGAVNIPPYRASTVLFETLEEYNNWDKQFKSFRYGRLGSPNSLALEEAYSEITGAYRSIATSSGMSAINIAVSAFLKQGDHALVTQGCYEPAAELFNQYLTKFGIDVDFFSPIMGSSIADLILPTTKIVYLEAPSSVTFEVPDIELVIGSIREKSRELDTKIIIIFDNTWAGPLYFRSLDFDIDIEVQAATKSIVGHSDAMLGLVACTKETYQTVKDCSRNQGISVGPDTCYLGLRGLRTMGLRMEAQYDNAKKIAEWLHNQQVIKEVFYPPVSFSKFHDNWSKTFLGGGSLMSMVLDNTYSTSALAALLDNMDLFGMGYSYGGYESLLTPCRLQKQRISDTDDFDQTMLRMYIGLEDINDLIADLDSGFKRLVNH